MATIKRVRERSEVTQATISGLRRELDEAKAALVTRTAEMAQLAEDHRKVFERLCPAGRHILPPNASRCAACALEDAQTAHAADRKRLAGLRELVGTAVKVLVRSAKEKKKGSALRQCRALLEVALDESAPPVPAWLMPSLVIGAIASLSSMAYMMFAKRGA